MTIEPNETTTEVDAPVDPNAAEKAIESHFEDARERAERAAREVRVAEEKADKAADKAPPKKEPPAKDAVADGAPPEDERTVAAILKGREERQRARLELQQARSEMESLRAEMARERETLATQRREAEEIIALLRTDPVAAVKRAGWDPEGLVTNLAKEGTPEAAAERRLLELNARLEREAKEREALQKRIDERESREREAQESAQRSAVERAFVESSLNVEKFPYLTRAYKGREDALVAEAHAVGRAYHAKTGEWASNEEIAAYLDGEWKSRMIVEEATGQVARREVPATRQKPAVGSRTVSTATASERRTTTRDMREASWDERLQAAEQAAREAREAAERDGSR